MAKTNSLTGWLFDKLFGDIEERAPTDVVQEHAVKVRNASGGELAGLLAAALFAKKTLDTTRQVDDPFPDKYVLGEAPIDAAAQGELTAYAVALERFQVALIERDSARSLAVARGLNTWIATFYAMARPETLPQAREMWAKLIQGHEGLDEAFKLLLRRLPSDVELTYFKYRPTLLTD